MRKVKVSYITFYSNIMTMTFWNTDKLNECFVKAILNNLFVIKSTETTVQKFLFILMTYNKNSDMPNVLRP